MARLRFTFSKDAPLVIHVESARRSMSVAGAAAYLSIRFLLHFFQTRTLTPFAVSSLVAGLASIVRFA
jgi:undecaprenyl pyrophosphate phosphatase UppP